MSIIDENEADESISSLYEALQTLEEICGNDFEERIEVLPRGCFEYLELF